MPSSTARLRLPLRDGEAEVGNVVEEREGAPPAGATTKTATAGPRGLIPGALLSLAGMYFLGTTARDQWENSPSRSYVVFPRRQVGIEDYFPGVICLVFGAYHLLSYFIARRKLAQKRTKSKN